MFRGTTPTIEIKVETDMDFNDIQKLWLTFKTQTQEVTKQLDEVQLDNENKTITCTLSQTDTLMFPDDSRVEVQLRGLSVVQGDSKAWASDIGATTAKRILKGGEI